MRTSFETADQQVAAEQIRSTFGSEVRFRGDPRRVGIESLALSDLAVLDVDFEGALSFRTEGNPWFGVATGRTGTLSLRHDQDPVHLLPGTLMALPPSREVTGHTTQVMQQRILRIGPAALSRALRERGTGEEAGPVRLQAHTVASRSEVRRWQGITDLVLAAEGGADVAATHPLALAALARLAAHTALSTFGHDDLGATTHHRDAAPDAVRRAVAFIESNAHADISLVEIAAAACVTPRALQYGFRRTLDTTPMAHLRRVRLHHVRAELLEPTTGTTVAQVAGRWGFFHLGRFARYYRDEFGENPARTLSA